MSELDAVRRVQSYAGWVPRQAVDVAIAALEAELNLVEIAHLSAHEQARKAEAEVREWQEAARLWREDAMDSVEYRDLLARAERAEADAVIPLSEEQAEAFTALNESIRAEQSLRDEVAALKKDRDYYREHYELVFKQRNEAEADLRLAVAKCIRLTNSLAEAEAELTDFRRLAESLDGDRTLERIAELEAEVAALEIVAEDLQTELLQAALDHDFSIPTLGARLARYEEEADAP